MRNAVITVEVTVDNVPDHISDQQVIDQLSRGVRYDALTWPEPRSFVRSARVVTPDTAKTENAAPAEA